MGSISITSMMICAFLTLFLLLEIALFIRSINLKSGNKVLIHLIGVVATALISYSVIRVTLGAKSSSTMLTISTVGISSIFFIFYGFDSLYIDKSKKN